MILSVSELKEFITTNKSDKELELELLALESSIRKYTNNNFQNVYIRYEVDILNNKILLSSPYLKVGDTIQISNSRFNSGVYVIKDINEGLDLGCVLYDENKILITKIEYSNDIKLGAIEMLRWKFENAEKINIASETISRHSISYKNDFDTKLNFPKEVISFLNKYVKPRF